MRWEYYVASPATDDREQLQSFMAEVGRQGWELMGVVSGGRFFLFKRQRKVS